MAGDVRNEKSEGEKNTATIYLLPRKNNKNVWKGSGRREEPWRWCLEVTWEKPEERPPRLKTNPPEKN